MIAPGLLITVLLLGLPLLGVLVTGKPVAPYLEFPPRTRSVEPPAFSWVVFVGVAVTLLAATIPFLRRILRAQSWASDRRAPRESFPIWGWGGLLLLSVSWLLAWSRLQWFVEWQSLTFTPLWLGYIFTINAVTCRRAGRCLLRDRPGFLLALFPLSAAFWWFFEYLNRFVQNWHYVGIREFTAGGYVWHATLSFATVLPAVLSTVEWLGTFPAIQAAARDFPPIRLRHPMQAGAVLLLMASLGLMGIGVWPQYLFPLLWVSPLVLIIGVQLVFGVCPIMQALSQGDWRPIWIPALAGLQCGLCWEMWNYYSLARWEYQIPFVDRFAIFEMPILGYGGYLPFGIECYVVAVFLTGHPALGIEARVD